MSGRKQQRDPVSVSAFHSGSEWEEVSTQTSEQPMRVAPVCSGKGEQGLTQNARLGVRRAASVGCIDKRCLPSGGRRTEAGEGQSQGKRGLFVKMPRIATVPRLSRHRPAAARRDLPAASPTTEYKEPGWGPWARWTGSNVSEPTPSAASASHTDWRPKLPRRMSGGRSRTTDKRNSLSRDGREGLAYKCDRRHLVRSAVEHDGVVCARAVGQGKRGRELDEECLPLPAGTSATRNFSDAVAVGGDAKA